MPMRSKTWEMTLLSPDTTVRSAIKMLNMSALQICIVVDENRCLLGTVTDGDIRRAILRNVSLESPIEKIMIRDPVVGTPEEDNETLLTRMKVDFVSQIPLLDADRRIVGLSHIDDLLRVGGIRDNWVVLMAGGLGQRLRPITNDVPKPLLHVGGRPLLQNILERFVEQGFRNFYISVNYKSEMIVDHFGDGDRWGANIRYLMEDEALGTAGSLSLIEEPLDKDLLVMNGDLLTKVSFENLLDYHIENKAAATMGVREYDVQVPFGVVHLDDHRVLGIDEKPTHRFFVNAGIYVISPEVLTQIPKDRHLDMPQLIQQLIDRGSATAAFPLREYWLDIGRIDDWKKANRDFDEKFK
jgi:dTDP-glucose pyrophosphorylase